MQRLIHPAAASRNGAYFQGRVLAEPAGITHGGTLAGMAGWRRRLRPSFPHDHTSANSQLRWLTMSSVEVASRRCPSRTPPKRP